MAFQTILQDGNWAERKISTSWLIGLTTFGILALELGIIRWTSSQVRMFAYFNNVVLIGAFLGMGLGVALGRKYPGLVHLALPALFVLALPLAFAEPLGLVHLSFPDNSVVLWGATDMQFIPARFARNIAIFLALYCNIVGVFVCCGAPLGHLFSRLPVLRAYSADLTGSLLGVLIFTITAWMNAGPTAWLALGCLPFVLLARKPIALILAIGIIGLGHYSVHNAIFSPYNRILLTTDQSGLFQTLEVNRDFHQYLHNLSDARLADPMLSDKGRELMQVVRKLYDLPFVVNARRDTALVVGAGTGNDVQAALRNGYKHVESIDIDGRIIALGREHHPEQPYANPAVTAVVDDARAYFEKKREKKFDVVCYGFLDSHAMSSAMSTLRLDNYVYTEEGLRAAWKRVGEGGHLTLAISCIAGRWFFERIYWTLTKATGKEPRAYYNPLHSAVTYIVARDGVLLDESVLQQKQMIKPQLPMFRTRTTSDDWPFLYIRPGIFPWGYVLVIGFILLLTFATVRPVFGIGRDGNSFDLPLFLMGAAFMLIETRGVTSMSLLFGSTWVVNAAIFSGILIMVLLANLVIERLGWRDPRRFFALLFLAVAMLWWFPVSWLQTFDLPVRGLLGGLLTGLPVGLAGLIVPILLARSVSPAAALGSNLLGSVLGGCLEYFSMIGGLKSTALMALVLYLLAFMIVYRRQKLSVQDDTVSGEISSNR